jgi:hypothetical protein
MSTWSWISYGYKSEDTVPDVESTQKETHRDDMDEMHQWLLREVLMINKKI